MLDYVAAVGLMLPRQLTQATLLHKFSRTRWLDLDESTICAASSRVRRVQFNAIDAGPSHRNCWCEPAADELLANALDFFGVLAGPANRL